MVILRGGLRPWRWLGPLEVPVPWLLEVLLVVVWQLAGLSWLQARRRLPTGVPRTTLHQAPPPIYRFTMGKVRYRWRTALRRRTPWVLVNRGLFAKGERDCGDHEFYNADDVVERCYHCKTGVRPYDPTHFVGR